MKTRWMKVLALAVLISTTSGCFWCGSWRNRNCGGCGGAGYGGLMGSGPMYSGSYSAMGCSDCGSGIQGTMVSGPVNMGNSSALPPFGSSAGTNSPEKLPAPAAVNPNR